MIKRLDEQVVFISGATGAIGGALASAVSALGAQCILLGRNPKRLGERRDSIVATGGPAPLLIPFDLLSAEPSAYQQLTQPLEGLVGKVDALYHLAAQQPKLTPIEHYDVRHWFEVMQISCHAPFLLTQSLLPFLRRADAGHIVFPHVSAEKPYWGAHRCAQAASLELQQLLATELENTNIKTHRIAPGPCRTPFRRRAYPAEDLDALKTPEAASQAFLAVLTQ